MRVLKTDSMDVLPTAARKHGIQVHFGTQMTRIKESEKDATVNFADDSMDTVDLLLGCDGIYSTVRTSHVNPETSLEYTSISNAFAILPTSSLSGKNHNIAPALHTTLTC